MDHRERGGARGLGWDAYQTTRYSWMWLATQQSLVRSAVVGVSICPSTGLRGHHAPVVTGSAWVSGLATVHDGAS